MRQAGARVRGVRIRREEDEKEKRIPAYHDSLDSVGVRNLYERLYCARGDMENRIKERFSLFVDRVTAET